jgi:hypothetical protein
MGDGEKTHTLGLGRGGRRVRHGVGDEGEVVASLSSVEQRRRWTSRRWQRRPLDRLGFGVGGGWAVNLVA